MFIDDIQARMIKSSDIEPVFIMAKQCLEEKGIEKIRDDILLLGIKNAMVKPYQFIDVGLFKLNTLVGFAFAEFSYFWFEQPTAKLNTIYLAPEHRTEENYEKLWNKMAFEMKKRDIEKVITTDNWTLVNDCDIFLDWLQQHTNKMNIYEAKL